MGSPRKDAHLGDRIDVGETAATQPNESRRIQTLFEIFQSIGHRMPLIADRGDVQHLAIGHD